jgi:hypothetical protein
MAEPAPPNDGIPGIDDAAPGESRVRRRKLGWPARIAIGAGSALVMAGLLLLGAFLALSSGPVSAPFLTERVSKALEARLGDHIDVTVGTTKLEKTADGIEIHIFDVVFRETNGREILRSPEAYVGFDPLQLASLQLAPRRLTLKGMHLKAEIGTDGDVRLMTGDARGSTVQSGRLEDALALLVAVARTGKLSGLSTISIADGTLAINDRRAGRDIGFDKVSAVFETREIGVSSLWGSLGRGGATIPFKLAARTEGVGARFDLSVSDLPLSTIEAFSQSGQLPMTIPSNATLTASATTDAAGKLTGGTFKAALQPGQISIPAIFDGPLNVREASVDAAWSGRSDRLDAVTLRYVGDGSQGTLAGVLHLPSSEARDYRFEGQTQGLAMAPATPRDKPAEVMRGAVRLRVGQALDHATLDALELDGPETNLRLTGHVKAAPGGAAARLDLAARQMPVRTSLAWWPGGFGGGGKRYLAGAVRDGRLNSLTIRLDLPPDALKAIIADQPIPAEALKLDIAVENASVEALDGLPIIAGLSGGGQLNAQNATFSAARGTVDLKGAGKRIALTDGVVQLNRLETWMPDIAIGFRAQAAAENVAEFLSMQPITDVFSLQVNPQDIRGQFDGRVRVSFPLGKELKRADVVTEAQASLKGVTIEKAIGKDKLENANLTIAADGSGVEVKGDGRWQGMPVTVSLENDAKDKSSATVLSLTLDEAAQKRFGIPGVTGPLGVKVRALKEENVAFKAQAEVDLTRAAIDGLIPGFQKPASRPGKLTFDITERPRGGYALQNIALDSGAASIRGQAEVAQDSTLSSARFSLFRLSPGDNVRLDFDRVGPINRVMIRGNNLDARPFLRNAMQDPGGQRGERDLDIDLKTTLLSGHGGEVLTNAEARIQRRGGQTRQVSMTGRLNGKALTITGQAPNGAAPVTIETDDAGAFLRFVDIYSRMIGGDLSAQVRPGARDMSGYMIARSFNLRNEPALRRLMSETPADGARVGDSAQFTKMRIDFNRTGSATTIRESVIFGPQIGVTFNGIVDFARDRISLSGTYIPAYGLNNAFAQIPVLGTILGGGRNEGLLAVTFGVSGRASQPDVSINPLSAVAPGIFRKIFEFRNDGTGATSATRRP